MKNFLLLFYLLSVAAWSCKDDEPEISACGFSEVEVGQMANPPAHTHPCDYLFATKAGSDWKVHARTYYGNDTLGIAGDGHEQSFSFRIKFTGTGTYEIRDTGTQYFRSNASYYTTVGGDVIVGYYYLDGTGAVEVSEYSVSEKLIKGRFNVKLKKQLGETSAPDNIEFTSGEFSVHLPD
jgi:hypothetical protein